MTALALAVGFLAGVAFMAWIVAEREDWRRRRTGGVSSPPVAPTRAASRPAHREGRAQAAEREGRIVGDGEAPPVRPSGSPATYAAGTHSPAASDRHGARGGDQAHRREAGA